MTSSAPAHLLALTVVVLLHALTFGAGAGLLTIGGTQIARTLRVGSAATNADAVIMRSGMLIGVGAAALFLALAR